MIDDEAVARLLTLMKEIEFADALDFGDVPIEEDDARRLVALTMLQMQADMGKGGVRQEMRELVLLATAGHLVLENFLLHYQRLKRESDTATLSLEDLMARLKRRSE